MGSRWHLYFTLASARISLPPHTNPRQIPKDIHVPPHRAYSASTALLHERTRERTGGSVGPGGVRVASYQADIVGGRG